ncbi:MAG: hypothetical protein HYZ58_00235 [Acidobacteria bacterium]|nr:hypothetical protein [Acidobacteriota bacterium]
MKHGVVRIGALAAGLALAVRCAGIIALAAQGASKVDVTGTWVLTVETSQGSGTPTFTFKQDGEKLTGKYVGQFGEATLTGTVKGQTIDYSFTIDAQGTPLEVTYAGKVENKDSMSGSVNYGGVAQGTFTGKRK